MTDNLYAIRMKPLMLTLSLVCIILGTCFSQTGPRKKLHDGLYLIVRVDTLESQPLDLKGDQTAVYFSPMFEDFNDGYNRIIIDSDEYVPLELEKPPVTEQQTELKKKLLLSLTPEASEKLKTFSTAHVMHRVALVIDGEALTVHKIREPLTSGQLQITRCTDNACERLYVKLKDNVKK